VRENFPIGQSDQPRLATIQKGSPCHTSGCVRAKPDKAARTKRKPSTSTPCPVPF
jgi:hypothetical protein